jgi:type II secretory pathway predicted ATPase ExeA
MKKRTLADLVKDQVVTDALAKLNSLHVKYPAFSENLEAIERCRMLTALSGRPHCIAILGESGVGKTHLAEQLKMRHPDREEVDRIVRPILLVEVPKHATSKGLLGEMLTALGCKESVMANRVSLLRSLLRLLDELQVDTIVIDEGQHMAYKATSDGEVADWLKTLINRSGRTIVLMGTPSTERMLASSECQQTATRFQRVRHILPFYWKEDKNGSSFRLFLQQVDGVLPFRQRSNLADPEVALRLFCATRGYLRMVFRILNAACLEALVIGAEKLDNALLDQAMRIEVNERIPLIASPFTAQIDKVMEAVLGNWAPIYETPQSKRPGKQPKPKKPSESLVK